MGWLEGVLTGYADRHYDIAKQKRLEAEQAAEREAQVYQTLLNSEYPEIQNLAGAGILDLANPRRRKGGIAGWMGEMQQSPYLDAVRRARERISADPAYADQQLGRTGVESGGRPPVTPSIPSPAGSVAPPPPGQPSAALPETSLVTGGPATPPTPAPHTIDMPGAPPPGAPRPGPPPAPGIPDPQAPASLADPTAASLGMTGATYGAPAGGPPAPPYGPIAEAPTGAANPAIQADLGHVAAGLPGATTRTLGPPPTVPRGRTDLTRPRPGIFPTVYDAQRRQSRAAVAGKVEAYAEMYRAQGFDEATAQAKAAELMERDLTSGVGGMPYSNTRGEYTDPATGQVVRTPVVFDRSTGRYSLPDGRPAPADLQIVAAGRLSQPVETAALEFGFPSATAVPPALMPKVLERARAIEAENISSKPLSPTGRAALAARLVTQWNGIQAPIRMMEVNVRNMAENYKLYKAGDRSAWEAMRTAFVHIAEPNSVVMPSEFARAAGVLSWKDAIWGYIQKAQIGGSPLPDHEIDEMVRAADAMWQGVSTYGAAQRSAIEAQIADPMVAIPREQVFGSVERFQPDWGTGGGTQPQQPAPTTTGAGPAQAPGPVDWNTPLQYDPVTRKMVPRR